MQPVDQLDPDVCLAIDSRAFAVRFGRLLATTRRVARLSVEQLAAPANVGFDVRQLKQFERGRATIDESIVEALCLLYAADVGQVLPGRRPVTITGCRLFGPGSSVEFSPDDPTSLLLAYLSLIRRMRNERLAPAVALRRDDILVISGYLGIDGSEVVVRLSTLMHASPAQRTTMAMLFAAGAIVIGLTAGGQAAADGTSASPGVFGTSAATELVAADTAPAVAADDEVVTDTEVAAVTAPAKPTIAPHLTASVIAAPVIARVTTPAGPSATGPAAAPVTPPVTQPVPAPLTAPVGEATATIADPTPTQDVDQGALLEMNESPPVVVAAPEAVIDEVADVVGLSPATRLQVPEPAPTSTAASEAPTANPSGCNPDPSEAVMSVVIPDIAYACPVYAGGQAMLDAGFVTLVTDAGASPVLATRPGEPGTLWLAGHRSTHGAAFASVPDLADGALVTVSADGATATYRVVGRAHFEVRGDRVVDASGSATAAATWASVIRDDLSGNLAPRLVLQTCDGASSRVMVYADLVS